MQSAVSVVIPCFNAAAFLRATLDSVLGQTHPRVEVIVVDDGSTDDSAAIAQSYGPPVRVFRQTNQGESVARNYGISVATGDYFLFLDADDVLAPDTMTVELAAIADVRNGVAQVGWATFHERPEHTIASFAPKSTQFFPPVLSASPGPPHTFLVPAGLVRAVGGFDTTLRHMEDWHFWARVAFAGGVLVPVPYLGAYYRKHPHSQCATRNALERALGIVTVLERLCQIVIDSEQLLTRHGSDMFWSAAYHLDGVLDAGVTWPDVSRLVSHLEQLAVRQSSFRTRSQFITTVRYLGYRRAHGLRRGVARIKQLATWR